MSPVTFLPEKGDGVGQDLEGEEGDADGQDHRQHREFRAQETVDVLQEEIRVLEVKQKPHVLHDGGNQEQDSQPGPPGLVHGGHDPVVEEDGGQEDQEEIRLPHPVEHQGGRHQPELHPGGPPGPPQELEAQEDHGEKQENKSVG